MHHLQYSRGHIKLFPLPGTETYVRHVARWLVTNDLNDIRKNGFNLANYYFMDEDEAKALKKLEDNEENLLDFLTNYLIGNFNFFTHRNGAVEVQIDDSVRRKDIYIFHTFSEANIVDYNCKEKHLYLADQELLLYNTLDAFLEAKTDKISIFELNLGQARSDRPKGRGSCNLRTFFRTITANGANHLLVYQIHAPRSLIGIDLTQTTYDNLSGEGLLKKYILRAFVKDLDYFENVVQHNWVFSSVDAGGKDMAAKFAKSFNVPLVLVDKRRNPLTNQVEEIIVLKPENLSIEDKTVFIVDDMIDSAGSIIDVCRKYKELGAKEIIIAVIYGLFSSPAEERLRALMDEGALHKVIVTDLITLKSDFIKRNPYIHIADTTYTTARVLQKTNQGLSLEKYFLPLNARKYIKNKIMKISENE